MVHKKVVQKQNVLNKLFKPFFSSFTKDKWHSRNPEVRKKAVQELPVSDQETLSNIAMNDSDETIRAIAANKLSDLDLLQTIIMKGTNGTVKEAAQNRLFQLICGLKHPIPEFDIREKMIRGSRNSALLEFVAANAVEASLREITIKKISRDPLLGNIALADNNAHIRQLAAQQIAKRSTLERVSKQSRRKDKRVYKIVKSKLDHIIEDEQRPALLAKEVVEICNKLEKLHKRNLLLQEKTTFENFVARWSEIQNFADPGTTERYHTICSSIINSMDQLELELNKEQDAIQNLETLLSSLSNAVDDLLNARESVEPDTNTSEPASETASAQASDSKLEAIKTTEKIIQNLDSEWHEVIKAVTHNDLISTYNSKFQSILDLADAKTVSETADKKNDNKTDSLEKIQSLTEQAEYMLDKSGFILEKTISALQHKFQQQIETSYQHTDNQPDEVKIIQQKFESAIQTLKEQSTVQQKNAKKFKQQITLQADKIKSLISNGLVSKAEKLLREQLKIVDQSDLISNIDKQNLHHELQQMHSQLDDLSSWRNWAHDNERENLAVKAEQLVQQISNSTELENEYTDITSQVKEFRKQWKSMHSHTQEDIWQRFNNACNLVYEQCKPFIDKQNEIRKDNLKTKQDLCKQLENYIKTMGWPSSGSDIKSVDDSADNTVKDNSTKINQSIDWIQVDKITKQARKEWSAIGFVERKHHKSINRRFDKDIDIIRGELKQIWHINHEKFFDLIHKIEALHDTIDDDLSDAINKAKNYQTQWKKIGPVSSYQRNKLWKRFRKGCDFVFDKRQENIEQKNQLNTERLREKEAICENLEALNQQPLKQKDLQNAYSDIENLWLELVPQAKSLSKEINARYTLAVEAYQRKINELMIEQQKQLLEQIIQQADLCTQIESSTDSSDEAMNQFNQRWQALNENKSENNSSDSKLKKRYENALNSIAADKEPLIQIELDNKRQYCLKYEILLGKETPAEDQQSRMEMQVELLNSNLGQNRTEKSDSSQITHLELQLEWYKISNYSQNKQLDDRLMNIIAD